MERFIDWNAIGTYLIPIITGIAGWIANSRKRRNDFLKELQSNIDLLAQKNTEILTELVSLRTENASLKVEVIALRSENAELKKEIEQLNSKLEGVRTITKIKNAEN